MDNFGNSMKPVDILFILYNALVSMLILIRLNHIPYWYIHIVIHLLLILIPVLYSRMEPDVSKSKISNFFRHWYPYLFFGLFYEEIGWINTGYVRVFLDDFFAQWDYSLFGFHPSLEFMKAVPNRLFSEYMYFAYFFYLILLWLVGMVFWVKKDLKNFYSITFTTSLVYYFFYTVFVFLPVAGPRFFFPGTFDVDFKGYFFAPLMQNIMGNVEIKGAAFPSSHCGIACIAALYAYKVKKYFGVIITIIAASLWTGTVYGRFHYVVDVIYGVGLAIIMYILSPKLYKAISK